MRVRVKICGITRAQDALAAVAAGADAIGLNFHPASPRVVTLQQACAIAAVVPPYVSVVGLFVDASAARIRQVLNDVPLAFLQFHGSESAAECEAFQRPYIKVLNVDAPVAIDALVAAHPHAAGYQLDASVEGVRGGSGRTFDWTYWPRTSHVPLILAGGLNPHNVGAAVRATRPFAVDVSSGVESAPGVKDAALMQRFIEEVSGTNAWS